MTIENSFWKQECRQSSRERNNKPVRADDDGLLSVVFYVTLFVLWKEEMMVGFYRTNNSSRRREAYRRCVSVFSTALYSEYVLGRLLGTRSTWYGFVEGPT
jgi:hypothetical protein